MHFIGQRGIYEDYLTRGTSDEDVVSARTIAHEIAHGDRQSPEVITGVLLWIRKLRIAFFDGIQLANPPRMEITLKALMVAEGRQ
jgi:hypothetical protein